MYKLYDHEEQKLVKRLGPVKRESFARGNGKELEYLIRAIWKTNQLTTKYNLLSSNCQNFAEFVFKEASLGRMKWSTWITAFVDRIGLSHKKSQIEIEADTLKYKWKRKDAKFVYYKAMAEGRRQDFEELAKNNLTTEILNSVDSQGPRLHVTPMGHRFLHIRLANRPVLNRNRRRNSNRRRRIISAQCFFHRPAISSFEKRISVLVI
jgi:hypothetical protein